MPTDIVWIGKELRLQDNTALVRALEDSSGQANRLLLVLHLKAEAVAKASVGQHYFWAAAEHFRATCAEQGVPLYLMEGGLEKGFSQLQIDFPAIKRWYFNYHESGEEQRLEFQMMDFLADKGVETVPVYDSHLTLAKQVLTDQGTPYKVFTPYYNKWQTYPKPAPAKIDLVQLRAKLVTDFDGRQSAAMDKLKKWAAAGNGYRSMLGEVQANVDLSYFIDCHLADYEVSRDYLAQDATSHLSAYLITGQISIRQVYAQVSQAPRSTGQATFIKELAWRDFYHMIYHYHPDQKQQSIIKKYRMLKWRQDKADFERWARGETGFPIVDAAMKQLDQRGWMHNRLRMIVASFLVKDLLIDWRWGEEYFAKHLIDYDSASNIGGWQWSASVGTDACPYFRVFNPTTQSQKVDPNGEFIRQYLPQLKTLPTKYIHQPERMPSRVQTEVGVVMGRDYPLPMVDHKQQRLAAIELFQI